MHQKGCAGCEALDIADPLERAHRLLDLRVASGGYDHYEPLMNAIDEASRQCVSGERDPRTVGRAPVLALDAQVLAEEIVGQFRPVGHKGSPSFLQDLREVRAIIERHAAGSKA